MTLSMSFLFMVVPRICLNDASVQRQVLDLLDGWLRHKSDMVNFEAARAICEMKSVPVAQMSKAISGLSSVEKDANFTLINGTVLQLFLSSPKPVLKFAATRTLAALALTHPTGVATCNVDLESLIADPNRSVATYAITTLLKVIHVPYLPFSMSDSPVDWK